jgi:hypothetical protein
MKIAFASALGVMIVTSAADAQTTPITKRAVLGNTIQASAPTIRVSSTVVEKLFLTAYGGEMQVFFKLKSNGSHQADVKVFFADEESLCEGSTSSSTYQEFACGAFVPAGGLIDVVLFPNGAPAAICCVTLRYDLVDMTTPGVTLQD